MRSRRSFALFVLLVPALTAWAGTLVPEPDQIDDRAARIALAEISVRAGRFAEAVRAYDQLLASEKTPSAALLLAAGNARLYAGDVAGALPFYRRAAETAPADPAARRAFALALAWTGRLAEARPLLETLAVELPADEEISRALVAVSAGDPGAADRGIVVLRQRVAREPGNATAKADLADLLAMRGHAAEARALYDAARAQVSPKPGDVFDLRHARARLTWGDFYPAESAFRAALAATPGDVALRGDLLALLISMDRLERAEALALTWLDEQPDSPVAFSRLIEIQRKRHDAAAVAALLAQQPEPPRTPPAPGSPSARFAAAGRDAVREEAFVAALTGPADGVVPETAPRLVEWSGLYAGQGDFELAIRCLRAARRADPEYFPAWLGLAEFLAIGQHYDEAHREFAALAVAFPDNRQVLLKQARALGWSRRYDDSLAAYEHLRSLNPDDPVPLLEQARVAGWAKQRDQADRLYALRWEKQEIDARLFAGLQPLLPDWGKRGEDRKVSAHEEPFHYTERFEAELPALIAAATPETAAKLQKLRLDLRADFLLQRAFWLENRAKQLAWDRRWWRSEETYDRLLAVVPGNQEALFDLSQVQAAQGLGDRERVTLGRLLALDANNRLAAQALFRRERRSEPLVFGAWDYYREKGRDQLSSIRRHRTALGAEAMIDDRFRVRGAFLNWKEKPTTALGDFRARGFMIGIEGVPTNWLTFSADYTHKDNDEPGIGSVDTGGAQAWIPLKDAFKIGAGIEVREEMANEFAYTQGIRSTHRWLGAQAALSRRFEVEARAVASDYADNNAGTHLWIAPAYTWTDHPRTFKTTLTLEARDTDEANTYVFAGPTLVNIVHPYWTPQDYRGAALTLEWRHDLARDFFIGAQEHWYDVRVTFGVSNDDNQGVSWAADYAREWRDRWVLRLGVSQTFSQQWDDFRASARFAFRF